MRSTGQLCPGMPEVLHAHLQALEDVDEIRRSLRAARAEQRSRKTARRLMHHQQRCQLLLLLSLLHLRMHIGLSVPCQDRKPFLTRSSKFEQCQDMM